MQEYNSIDQRLHLLCQILAKVAANHVPDKEDYSHTNLGFDTLRKRIQTRWIKITGERIFLAIDLDDFSFVWVNETLETINSISIHGKTLTQLENEVLDSLHHIGIKSEGFSIDLKYNIAEYTFIHEPFGHLEEKALNSWISYRKLANEVCGELLGAVNTAEEIRIWPHHFDTGIYTEIDKKLGIGFALAMKDGLVDAPYFYMSGYGLKHEINMDNLPDLSSGTWKSGDWKGAVLSLSDLDKLAVDKRIEIVSYFITQTLDWYLEVTKK